MVFDISFFRMYYDGLVVNNNLWLRIYLLVVEIVKEDVVIVVSILSLMNIICIWERIDYRGLV